MMSALYINIKKWLQMYGANVLDYFIQPDHPEERDPRKRYNNFDEQFNKHVGTSEHFQLNQGAEFPFLAIDIACDNSSKCFPKFYINFSVYYSSVSPPTGRVCIENTPEGKLEYREEVHCQIKNMLTHQVSTPQGIQRKTFAQDVASLENWYLPIKVKIQEVGCPEDFSNELVDEVEMFSFPVTLSIYTC
jgi:hypothetical protein|nr:MAG TPA: hypothetical protein [Caudoviricetes sp.]